MAVKSGLTTISLAVGSGPDSLACLDTTGWTKDEMSNEELFVKGIYS